MALATELISGIQKKNEPNNDSGKRIGGEPKRSYLPWRFENPEGLKTKEVKGTTMKWCSNDCHPQPVWCGRKNYLNRAEFANRMQESQKKEEKTENRSNYKPSSEFKIALAAMCSQEDFEHLEEKFFSKN